MVAFCWLFILNNLSNNGIPFSSGLESVHFLLLHFLLIYTETRKNKEKGIKTGYSNKKTESYSTVFTLSVANGCHITMTFKQKLLEGIRTLYGGINFHANHHTDSL